MDSIAGPFFFSFDHYTFPGRVLCRAVTFESQLLTNDEFLAREFRLLKEEQPSYQALKRLIADKPEKSSNGSVQSKV